MMLSGTKYPAAKTAASPTATKVVSPLVLMMLRSRVPIILSSPTNRQQKVIGRFWEAGAGGMTYVFVAAFCDFPFRR